MLGYGSAHTPSKCLAPERTLIDLIVQHLIILSSIEVLNLRGRTFIKFHDVTRAHMFECFRASRAHVTSINVKNPDHETVTWQQEMKREQIQNANDCV